jgi:phage antirepressor YoqD-like protein
MPIDNITAAAAAHPTDAVEIRGTAVERIAYKGARVVTFSQIDQVHLRPDGTAGRTFRENRDRFTEGADFIQVDQPDEIRRLGFSRPQGGVPASLTLVTERGYRRLCKSLNDDRAWDVFDEMLEAYFGDDHAGAPALAFDPADPQHVLTLVGHYAEQIATRDQRIAELEPKARDLDRLSGAKGSIAFRYAANTLGIRPKDLDVWLSVNDWTYRTAGNQVRAHTDKITAGFLEHSLIAVGPDKGVIKTNVLVTAAGMVELVSLIDPAQFVKTKKPRKRTKKVTGPSKDGAILIDLDGEAA